MTDTELPVDRLERVSKKLLDFCDWLEGLTPEDRAGLQATVKLPDAEAALARLTYPTERDREMALFALDFYRLNEGVPRA